MRRLLSCSVYNNDDDDNGDDVIPYNVDLSFSFFTSVPQQSKRLTTPAIALRSKSMTSELEEMGKDWDDNEDEDRKDQSTDVETVEREQVHMGVELRKR